MNQLIVKTAKMDLQKTLADLSSEKTSRQIALAKTKLEEAIHWLNAALESEQVFE